MTASRSARPQLLVDESHDDFTNTIGVRTGVDMELVQDEREQPRARFACRTALIVQRFDRCRCFGIAGGSRLTGGARIAQFGRIDALRDAALDNLEIRRLEVQDWTALGIHDDRIEPHDARGRFGIERDRCGARACGATRSRTAAPPPWTTPCTRQLRQQSLSELMTGAQRMLAQAL